MLDSLPASANVSPEAKGPTKSKDLFPGPVYSILGPDSGKMVKREPDS